MFEKEMKISLRVTVQSYLKIEEAYTKEFIKPVDSSSSHSQFTFVQQVSEDKSLYSRNKNVKRRSCSQQKSS